MIKRYFTTLFFISTSIFAWSQKYTVEKSTITFFSEAAIEDIAAENTKASSIFDAATGNIAFSIPINEFEFEKSLMKEHFNEKYLDTEKYPKSTFQGKLNGFNSKATGIQSVAAKGKLTIHGQTREINVPGTIETNGNGYIMKSKFIVQLEDYKIKIPRLMWQNIAEQVEVAIDFKFRPQ